jgi:hypothetical protein
LRKERVCHLLENQRNIIDFVIYQATFKKIFFFNLHKGFALLFVEDKSEYFQKEPVIEA